MLTVNLQSAYPESWPSDLTVFYINDDFSDARQRPDTANYWPPCNVMSHNGNQRRGPPPAAPRVEWR